MIQKITKYVVYADQFQENGEVFKVRSDNATVSPCIKNSSDIEKWEELFMAQTGKKHKITTWYPYKSIYTWFPKIKAILKNKNKTK